MESILDYFQAGHALTPLEALDRFGCMRLAAVVFSLKKRGWAIQSELIHEGEKVYGRYWLDAAAPWPTALPVTPLPADKSDLSTDAQSALLDVGVRTYYR
jgi:hypothetical protein